MIAVAVFEGLAGILHRGGVVRVGFLVPGFVHHVRHRHTVHLDTAVLRGMMAHAAFEPRHPRDTLHRQGYDEQAQDK